MNFQQANPLIIGGDTEFNEVNWLDNSYIMAADRIMMEGVRSNNRTGVSTYKIFGHFINTDLMEGYALLTTKQVFTRPMLHELIWMLNGETNIQYLLDNDVHIWDGWANTKGDLGPVYGEQWRNREDTQILMRNDPYYTQRLSYYESSGYTNVATNVTLDVYSRRIDQIQIALDRLKTNPDCRRIIVDAWNPGLLPTDDHPTKQAELGRQALPACHAFFQFGSSEHHRNDITIDDLGILNIYRVDNKVYMSGVEIDVQLSDVEVMDEAQLLQLIRRYKDCTVPFKRMLDTHLHLRSSDVFLGLPFNISSYAALSGLFCAVVGMIPRGLTFSFGDMHIYSNHVEQLQQQANNLENTKHLPKLVTVGVGPEQNADLKNLNINNFRVLQYSHCGKISADVAV